MDALGAIHNYLPTHSMYHIDIGIKLYIRYKYGIFTILIRYTISPLEKRVWSVI